MTMGETELIQAIGSVGFPIVAYLLVMLRTEKIIGSLTEAVSNNTKTIDILIARSDKNE